MTEPAHEDSPWQLENAFEWTEKAFDDMESGRLKAEATVRDGVLSSRVWGRCPRCYGQLDDRQVHTAVTNTLAGGTRGSDTPADEPDLVAIDVSCGCGRTHPGGPTGKTGCGVSFRVELEAGDSA